MRIAVGSDHAGFALKHDLADAMRAAGHQVIDVGTHSEAPVDYPDFARIVAEKLAHGEADRGLLCCGTGIGMAMVANKVRGVRAAAVSDVYGAQMARAHNDANVLCLGGRVVDLDTAKRCLRMFLETPFDAGRHSARVAKIEAG